MYNRTVINRLVAYIERINGLAIPAEVKEEAMGKLLLVLSEEDQLQD